MSKEAIKVLVLRKPNVTRLSVRRMLSQSMNPLFETVSAGSLSGVMEILGACSRDCKDSQFTAVLLELDALEGNKWKAIQSIRQMYPNTAVLALGRENQPHDVIKAFKAGAQDFLAIRMLQSELMIKSVVYAIERVSGSDIHASDPEKVRSMKLQWIIPGSLAQARGPQLGSSDKSRKRVDVWIDVARSHGIKSILCMLESNELRTFYGDIPGGLLAYYKRHGFSVGHVSVSDFSLPPLTPRQRQRAWRLYQKLPKPVLVHCRHGIARSGNAADYIRWSLSQNKGGVLKSLYSRIIKPFS